MALLSLQEIALNLSGLPVLDQVSLQFEADERVGLLGRNGAGKSTLMKLIAGDLAPGAGQVIRTGALRTALLEQETPPHLHGPTAAVVAAGLPASLPDGPPASQRVAAILTRLQLDPQAEFSRLSGGLQRRVLLARALVCDPHVLLLDEPTNHLDIDAIAWLEEFLIRFRGLLLFVTHDRTFLRGLATRIVELDRGKVYSFTGGYEAFLQRRESRLQAEAAAEEVFDQKLVQEEAWIRQGIQARRTRNEGRVRALERLREERRQRRERPSIAQLQIQEAARSGRLVIEARNLTFAYGQKTIVRDFSTLIVRGDRLGVVGPNGSGKTTLLRLLLGQITPQGGQLRHGTGLQIVHFDQLREQLDADQSVLANLADGQEYLTIHGQRRHIYGYLQDFLFTREQADMPVSALSGGERNRLLLARIFTRPANLLVLDEPTNDLDLETLELLEERLLEYPGTLLLVSHDRAFLDNVITSLLILDDDGIVRESVGGYSDYLRRRPPPPAKPKQRPATPPAVRRERPVRLNFKEQREFDFLPERIELLEAEQRRIQEQTSTPAFYQQQQGDQITAALNRLQDLGMEIATAYRRWEDLAARESGKADP